MIYPIVAFGDPVLRKKAKNISIKDPKLDAIIENMFETMYNANGVGLAAPQVGISARIFVIDATSMHGNIDEDDQPLEGFKKVFINPKILDETGKVWPFEEGCLSIPDIREPVKRNWEVEISYLDENLAEQTDIFHGIKARIIQHEYDHIEGVLFTDHLSGLKRQLLKGRLNKISRGQIETRYPMKFPKAK